MISCTFAGHADGLAFGVESALLATLNHLLEKDDDFCFFSGGMGKFDHKCEAMVQKAKKLHPNKQIRLLLVLPYMIQSVNTNTDYYTNTYDEIILPSELIGCHYKAAITKRNRWMVDHSQYMIAYVHKDIGRSYATLKYAQKHGLTIWNLTDQLL